MTCLQKPITTTIIYLPDRISPTIPSSGFIMAPAMGGYTMGYYLWGHTGSGDHADEDRIRGTCRLLTAPPEVISTCPAEELRYGIARLAGLSDRLPSVKTGQTCLTHRTDGAEYLQKTGARTILWGWSGAGMSRHLAKKLAKFDSLVVSEGQSVLALRDAGLTKKTRLGPDLSFLVEHISNLLLQDLLYVN